METTSVYGYNDFRKFLADWQAALQEADPALHKSEISKRLRSASVAQKISWRSKGPWRNRASRKVALATNLPS